MASPNPPPVAERIGPLLAEIRAAPPLVHCLTNVVAANFTANALLALGASPVMIEDADEATEVAAAADAVVVNLGTMDPARAAGMHAAATAARQSATPWLLDPVGVGAAGMRTRVAAEMVDLGPTAVRGNASEILVLAGRSGRGRGVDAAHEATDAIPAAEDLAARLDAPVAISGPVDVVTDARRSARLSGGAPVMGRVTAMGCALGAVMAAFLAAAPRTGDDAFTAVVAGSAVVGATGAAAADDAAGPGSFVPLWLDRLSAPEVADAAETLCKR